MSGRYTKIKAISVIHDIMLAPKVHFYPQMVRGYHPLLGHLNKETGR